MNPAMPCQSEHDFVLVLSGVHDLTPEIMDALAEAGCDDATPSLRYGRVYLTFTREAPSIKDAILSAIRDVRRANIGADVQRVDECNLVTQSEIAHRIGRTRQQIHQYITGVRGPGGFPSPVCSIAEGSPLWFWCEVAHWLWQNDIIPREVVDQARQVEFINLALDWIYQDKMDPALLDEVFRSLVGELGPHSMNST